MRRAPSTHVVHLELHTGDLSPDRSFYAGLCGWPSKRIDARPGTAPCLAIELGAGFGGGIVECDTARPLWLPYVEVAEITAATERAQLLGASLLLGPREGPAGWRSVVTTPAGGELALWQPKR